MLHATEILGAETFDSAGNFVGRVKEMFIEPADQPNRVARLLLGRGQYRPIVARYDQVASVAPGRVNLTTDESALELFHPNEAWLAVGKDLLDQQIIDTNGRKVVRVNDIDLAEQRTNGNVEIRITQVDVGVKGAVRRLLQGIVPPMAIRRLEQKLPPRSIRWEFVNLIEPDPLRRVKLRMSSQKLTELHPADLAEIMEELSPAERQGIIDSLPEDTAAEAIAELDKRLQTQVVEKLDPEKAADILEEMNPDEAADLIASLPPDTAKEVVEEMEGQEKTEVEALMRYEEKTAGGMMNTELVVVGEDATRGEVVDYIRFNEIVPDQLDNIVLINHYGALSGTVPIARLVIANSEQRMDELRFEPIVSVHPDANEKEVFELFDKYNLRGLTVVDSDNRPIGAITVDDVVSRMNANL
ncbi:MAG TPA: CBS domain-containing protein [Candidatus Acidoferrales bacterium]|jgi:CBS domain-containing protein|nr:CBS domain-containing protein [Candidatus Acidoferrales bacterium]